jgi:hypothetical protein
VADSISAIPQQPFLGRLAEFLRFLEKDRPEFLPRQLGVMQGISQLTLPQASTIENLSYGNQPFTMPPSGTGAMIPQVKTGRKAEVADLVSMISGVPGGRAVADVGTKLSNEAADALVRAITRNPQATAPGVIQETAMPFMQAVAPKPIEGISYEAPKFITKENNGILEVTPTSSPGFGQQVFGEGAATGLYPGTASTTRGLGQSLYGVSEQEANRQVQSLLKQPETNRAFQIANQLTSQNLNQPYQLGFDLPPSSLAKQSGIGRTYEIAAEYGDKYPKQTVFQGYLADPEYGPVIQRLGIKNYDDLLEQSYKQLEKETTQQFNSLPVRMSYHNGELNYLDSNEMLRDILGHNHLTVYRGGDRHEFLNKVDAATGLNSNEQFRAVHDYFGHAIRGNPFGAKGEEIAWASHQQMFSPLARIAMTAETRGQNSFVNYTPINAELVDRMESIRRIQNEARRANDNDLVQEAAEELRRLGGEWGYAKQASIVLPVEFTKVDFRGGMPNYLSGLVEPRFGATETLTHYGTKPDIGLLDPRLYGTGIKGSESRRIAETEQAIGPRSYAYRGQPGEMQPEPGLGPYVYNAQGQNLYDITPDPEKLALLARVRNTGSYLGPYGGILDQPQMLTDLERLVTQYGYSGLLDPQKAVLFSPQPVTRVR